MSEQLSNDTARSTVAMYDKIPEVFAGHFAGFRSTVPDIELAHQLAGVPMGESLVAEAGCGDGRDAETAFVPNSAQYVGFDPSNGLLELARKRFPGMSESKVRFAEGYAQSTEYPEDTDIIMAINSVLHVAKAELPDVFDRAAEGLRDGGVFYAVTKVEAEDNVEVYHDDFNGVTGERVFYHHSPETIEHAARAAGLVVIRNEITPVESKPWDWGSIAVQKQ